MVPGDGLLIIVEGITAFFKHFASNIARFGVAEKVFVFMSVREH
jgi:hypothetical protein